MAVESLQLNALTRFLLLLYYLSKSPPAHNADIEDGEVAQHAPVALLPPGDLRLGVGVHLSIDQ